MWKIIRGGRLLDIDGDAAEPADILIEDDTIRDVGRPGLAVPAGATTIDASRHMLMPGLINAHTHGHGSLSKGMGDRWTLELLLNASAWTSGKRTDEDKHLSAKLAAVEMVRKGCIAAYDLAIEVPAPTAEGLTAIGRAYDEVGMRAVIAPMLADRTLYQAVPGLRDALSPELRSAADRFGLAPPEICLDAVRSVLASWPFDRTRIAPAIAPTIPHHCSDTLLVGCRDLAREYDLGLHTHLAESRLQSIVSARLYGMSQTAHLEQLGLLGPRFTAAHAIWIDDDDIRRLADAGASVAHNAGANARLGSGIAAVRRMVETGVNVGIGTDGCTCSDNLNMFEAMRFASFVSRLREPDYARWFGAGEVLRMATEGGARALGFGAPIGAIRPGFKADIVFLDLGRINYVPLNVPTIQIVNAEDGTAVDSVMINGRLVLDHGRMTTVDEAKLVREAAAAQDRLVGRASDMKALTERLAAVVGPYCLALSRGHGHAVHDGGAHAPTS